MKLDFFKKIKNRIYDTCAKRGYTCDACKAELFDYPTHRLCEECESKLRLNNGRSCEKCGRMTLAEGVCLSCKSRLPRFHRAYSPFVYRGESASFINRIKTGNPTLALYFAEKMADCLIERFDGIEDFAEGGEELMVIPVPLTEERLRLRGYNQAWLLADRVCKRLTEKGYCAKLYEDVLQKTRDTAQQKHMDYVSRLENVAGAYHVHDRKACRGRTIVLVDDIMTTGATGSECASRLQSADAAKVLFLVGAALPERK
ncbi:MAG: ComF family protein [Clostridia bacterium]|nr:ComF family protein [Clostridia bacterium]